MFNFEDFFAASLERIQSEGRYRIFRELRRDVEAFPYARWNTAKGPRDILVWCSNDYLGMSTHREVLDSMHTTLDQVGAGSGGTRNISGTHEQIVSLEQELAQHLNTESALVFSSGYVANQTALAALAKHIPGALFFSDELNHDSMIQGLRLGGAKKQIFRHNDLAHLRQLLEAAEPNAPKIIVFESLYSMEGSFAPLREIVELAEEFGALTYLDETHAVVLYGQTGAGVAHLLGLSRRLSVIQGGLGKAFGVVGGFIGGSSNLIDFVRSVGNGFIFTTSLPPVVASGARASLRVIRKSNDLREAIQARSNYLRTCLDKYGIRYMSKSSHIVPVLVCDSHLCSRASERLLEEHGMYLQPINFPTVARGTERLRITPSPQHTLKHIETLAENLAEVWDYLGIARQPVLSRPLAPAASNEKSLALKSDSL